MAQDWPFPLGWNHHCWLNHFFSFFIIRMDVAFGFQNVANKIDATIMTIFWVIKLFNLGLLLQGGYYHGFNDLGYGVDLDHIHWSGILQKIAFAYLVITLSKIWVTKPNHNDGTFIIHLGINKNYYFQWVIVGLIISSYLTLFYGACPKLAMYCSRIKTWINCHPSIHDKKQL